MVGKSEAGRLGCMVLQGFGLGRGVNAGVAGCMLTEVAFGLRVLLYGMLTGLR